MAYVCSGESRVRQADDKDRRLCRLPFPADSSLPRRVADGGTRQPRDLRAGPRKRQRRRDPPRSDRGADGRDRSGRHDPGRLLAHRALCWRCEPRRQAANRGAPQPLFSCPGGRLLSPEHPGGDACLVIRRPRVLLPDNARRHAMVQGRPGRRPGPRFQRRSGDACAQLLFERPRVEHREGNHRGCRCREERRIDLSRGQPGRRCLPDRRGRHRLLHDAPGVSLSRALAPRPRGDGRGIRPAGPGLHFLHARLSRKAFGRRLRSLARVLFTGHPQLPLRAPAGPSSTSGRRQACSSIGSPACSRPSSWHW